MSDIEKKLADMGLSLPDAPTPQANYVPFVIAGNLVFVSGQISIAEDGTLIKGKLGAELDTEAGARAASRSPWCARPRLRPRGFRTLL